MNTLVMGIRLRAETHITVVYPCLVLFSMHVSTIPWYVLHLLIYRYLSKGIDTRIPAEFTMNCPDVHRGKAIAGTGIAIVTGTSFSALLIAVLGIGITIILCVLYGIGTALGAL
jgi:hypothetical protein